MFKRTWSNISHPGRWGSPTVRRRKQHTHTLTDTRARALARLKHTCTDARAYTALKVGAVSSSSLVRTNTCTRSHRQQLVISWLWKPDKYGSCGCIHEYCLAKVKKRMTCRLAGWRGKLYLLLHPKNIRSHFASCLRLFFCYSVRLYHHRTQ